MNIELESLWFNEKFPSLDYKDELGEESSFEKMDKWIN